MQRASEERLLELGNSGELNLTQNEKRDTNGRYKLEWKQKKLSWNQFLRFSFWKRQRSIDSINRAFGEKKTFLRKYFEKLWEQGRRTKIACKK